MVGPNVRKGGGVTEGTLEGLRPARAVPLGRRGEAPDRGMRRGGGEGEAKLPMKAMPIHQILSVGQKGDSV